MRRWNVLRASTTAFKPHARLTRQSLCSLQLFRPYQQDTAKPSVRSVEPPLSPDQGPSNRNTTITSQYAIFHRIKAPQRRIDDWAALLDGALPPHLREWKTTPPSLSATDVAEVLLAAQYPPSPKDEAFDLLFYLGFERGRWNAVVWLIKRLVEKFPARHEQNLGFEGINAIWKMDRSLEDATNARVGGRVHSIALDFVQEYPIHGRALRASLDALTTSSEGDAASPERLRHDALGQIWRTLGAMTKACAGGDIRSEVLEIIAYLHHKEVMPVSIYHSQPHPDPSAVQQPPLLSLLSSRILTSLSDAAWRAHEKLVVEEAKAQDARYVPVRPEVPGSVYRVHVAGLRPEVWMELILWSCIHGGWVNQGAEILLTLQGDHSWTAISWREYARAMYPDNRFDESWEYAFKTRASSSMDAPSGEPLQVERTVSAEVINAYIDAVACTVHTGVGKQEPTIQRIINRLYKFKKLLGRSKRSRLSISTGSWDALILRLLDAQGVTFESNPQAAHMLVGLSPGFGQGIERKNTQDLPSYVLDGGMAIQGFLHRVLHGQIASGHYEGAVAAFRRIQARADGDKQTSLADFMQGQSASLKALSENDLFTSNVPGIEYPAFDVQIPTGILGSFLDLVTTSKDYDLGRWLLHNSDLDGPLIHPDMYHDPLIEPAVVRFAAESNDQALLARFKKRVLHYRSLQAVLDTQIEAMRWEPATRILQVLDARNISWNPRNLARVVRAMLWQMPMLGEGAAGATDNFNAAKTMLSDMCSSRYHSRRSMSEPQALQMRNLLVVLAAADETLASLCTKLLQTTKRRYDAFQLSAAAFNIVLEGVVDAYGSAAGQRLLTIFWPPSGSDKLRSAGMHQGRIRTHDGTRHRRIAIRVHSGTVDEQELVVYGALYPTSEPILTILRKAFAELDPEQRGSDQVTNTANHDSELNDSRPEDIIVWGIQRLAELPYVEPSVYKQIDDILADHELHELRDQLSEIIQAAERDIVGDDEGST